jgi:hypothetical protein
MKNFLRATFDVVRMLVAIVAGLYAIMQAMQLYEQSLPGSQSGGLSSYAAGVYVGRIVAGSIVCIMLIWSFWWRPKPPR